MFEQQSDNPLQRLITLLAKLPGLGPRSARRVALALLKKPDALMKPLAESLLQTAEEMKHCSVCGNLDSVDPCPVCTDARRDRSVICVVEDVADLWAIERSHIHRGLYHVLGGTLSAIDGIGPEQLRIYGLKQRIEASRSEPQPVREVILALNATLEGQTTSHVVAEQLSPTGVALSRLAHGLPIGGELDYLDDGTLSAAFKARSAGL